MSVSTVATIHGYGLLAARPAVGAVPIGTLYFATDTGLTYRSNGTTWDTQTPAAGAPTAHKATHEVGGSDPFTGVVPGSAFAPAGLTGATAASRYVGATASGAPASGTFVVGDYVIAQNGSLWVCTTAGSPGTWTQVSGGGGGATSLLLDYQASTDLHSGKALAAATWETLGPSHSFTTTAGMKVVIMVGGFCQVGNVATTNMAVRLTIDSGATLRRVAGNVIPGSAQYVNPLVGISPIEVEGLSAAAHTVQVEVRADQAGNSLYLRAGTTQESLNVVILGFS